MLSQRIEMEGASADAEGARSILTKLNSLGSVRKVLLKAVEFGQILKVEFE
jgi:hypothetical protein